MKKTIINLMLTISMMKLHQHRITSKKYICYNDAFKLELSTKQHLNHTLSTLHVYNLKDIS